MIDFEYSVSDSYGCIVGSGKEKSLLYWDILLISAILAGNDYCVEDYWDDFSWVIREFEGFPAD